MTDKVNVECPSEKLIKDTDIKAKLIDSSKCPYCKLLPTEREILVAKYYFNIIVPTAVICFMISKLWVN